MGGLDKPLLRLAGVTLLARIAAVLQPQTDRLAISANGDPARFASFGLAVLADAQPGQGPLGGVLRGLDWAASEGCDILLTVAGDTPFIPADLVRALRPSPSVAVSGGRVHHTVALWPVSCRVALRTCLEGSTIRSVSAFAAGLGMREVAFSVEPFDPFFNINRPADLAQAARIARAFPQGPPAAQSA